jgi:phage anti-repressor protein/phage antirepressor YoqD-like protein
VSARQPHELLLAAVQQPDSEVSRLVPVRISIIGGETIATSNARDLHAFLGSKQHFADWIAARIKQYDFVDGHDFTVQKVMIGRATQFEYDITLNMAKELAMVERTPRGKEARQYYIECERRAHAAPARPAELSRMDLIEMAMAAERERIAADAKVQQLEHQAAEQAPAAAGFNLLAGADGSMCIRDAAAALKMRPCDLTDYLVQKEWIYQRTGAEDYKAFGKRLQALDLKYNVFGYTSKTTGDRKARQQIRITNKGLTKLAAMVAQDAVAKRLAAGAAQHQQRLSLPDDSGA